MNDNSREGFSSSTHITRFTCAYCNNIINRGDTQCPYCGAETASSIKKYMEIKKAEAEQCKTRINSLDKKRTYSIIGLVCALLAVVILSVLLFRFVGQSTVKTIVFTVLVLAYAVCLVTGIKGILKNADERHALYKRITGLSGNIIFSCEEVQLYKMINDSPVTNEGCYKEGFQQIAFKVGIKNESGHKLVFTLNNEFFKEANEFGYHVRLNADSVQMEDSRLFPFFDHHEADHKNLEPPLYTKGFNRITLLPQESLVGWVGFYLPPEAKNLELLFADEYVLLKNPAPRK